MSDNPKIGWTTTGPFDFEKEYWQLVEINTRNFADYKSEKERADYWEAEVKKAYDIMLKATEEMNMLKLNTKQYIAGIKEELNELSDKINSVLEKL